MTFWDLTVVIIRIQALWFVFNIAIDLTYLPTYFRAFSPARKAGVRIPVRRVLHAKPAEFQPLFLLYGPGK